MARTILVVDDEPNITRLLGMYLTKEGYTVETASDGATAVAKARATRYALILLDLMLPGMDGLEACRTIRRTSDVPIIMLTARSEDVDKIVGLEVGADDYVTKPFNPRELVARVKAVLRRYETAASPERQVLTVGDLVVDLDRREVRVGDAFVEVRAKEFALLVALARRPGVVIPRDRLLNDVWGYEYSVDTRTVDVHISTLRDRLINASARIETVWGVGYKLVAADSKP
ncbi:MAG: response regulator transcription factor [Thermomicrobia bacterium]|nr:response regulator transcription factor [Thermomicrobia bacterium]MCA1723002.1 response regulator transcription factor [Thermomicrobia bacterium]